MSNQIDFATLAVVGSLSLAVASTLVTIVTLSRRDKHRHSTIILANLAKELFRSRERAERVQNEFCPNGNAMLEGIAVGYTRALRLVEKAIADAHAKGARL